MPGRKGDKSDALVSDRRRVVHLVFAVASIMELATPQRTVGRAFGRLKANTQFADDNLCAWMAPQLPPLVATALKR